MPSLDPLIDRVLARVRSAERDGDRATVLSADVLEVADDLRRAAAATKPDAGTAARVSAALGVLHWARYRAGALEKDGDLGIALTLFEPLLAVRADLVPVPVLHALVAASAPAADDLDENLQFTALLLSIVRMIDEPDLLDDAVRRFRALLGQEIPDPVRGSVLSDLALALVLRAQRLDGRADLDEAVEAGRRAVPLLPGEGPEAATTLSNLGAALRLRFERYGDTGDLTDAVVIGQRAVDAAGPGDAGTAQFNLSVALRLRYHACGDRADLDLAVEEGRRAVLAVPDGDPRRPVRSAALANALQSRYEVTGRGEDLDGAVTAGQQAAAEMPSGHQDRAAVLSNLSKSRQTRFAAFGELSDLEGGLSAARAVVDAFPPGHPRRPAVLTNLGNALRLRFGRYGDPADIDEAVQVSRDAVAATPEGAPARAGRLNNLGNVLAIRTETPAALAADGDEALEVSRAAVEAADAAGLTSTEQVPHRVNLAARLRDRYRSTGAPADLVSATRELRTALDALPAGHPDRATVAGSLGAARFLEHQRTGDASAADEAVAYWREAATGAGARSSSRLNAAASWGSTLAAQGSWDGAAEGYGHAVALVSRVAGLGITRRSSEYRLVRTQGLARDAAACALATCQPGGALTWLEAGRAVLWSQRLVARSDLGRLADRRPDLGQRARALLALLDNEEG